jgi:aminoglycoside phosphotransferase (APT) family kinase protein
VTLAVNAARRVLNEEFGNLRAFKEYETWGPTLVVGATLDNDQSVVLKASAMQDVWIEAKAAEMALAAGVPTAKILARGENQHLPGDHWLAMEMIAGMSWGERELTDEQYATILHQIAHIFAKLHAIRLDGYGPLTADGRGTYDTWSTYLASSFTETNMALIKAGTLATSFNDQLLAVTGRLRPELDNRPATLVHGDLGGPEVIVDPYDWTVNGIVDWGASVSGDPYYEFARFGTGGPADDPRPARFHPPVRREYARLTSDYAAPSRELETLYRLHNTVLNARWSLREIPDWVPPLVELARKQLAEIS